MTLLIAIAGVAAVGVTWWLARSIAGPLAGFVAGLAMAVSASAIEESTFIWNPNLIALTSSIALAGAWRAWATRRARWWLVAAVGTALTMQCHVLGVTLLPIVAALLLADARRRGPGSGRRAVLGAGALGLAIIAVAYVPLAVHEATHDFSETRAALGFIAGGGEPSSVSAPVRSLVVLTRVVSWPVTGLITDAAAAALLALVLVIAIVVWRWRSRDDRGARGGPLARARARLDGRVPDVRGIRAGRGGARACRTTTTTRSPTPWSSRSSGWAPRRHGAPGRPVARTGSPRRRSPWSRSSWPPSPSSAIVGWNVAHVPPAVAADGGFPAAAAAARAHRGGRLGSSGRHPLPPGVQAAPHVRLPAGARRRGDVPEADADVLIIVCDDLFADVIGAACGGPAEDRSLGAAPFTPAGSSGGSVGTTPCSGSRRRRAVGSPSTDRPEGGAEPPRKPPTSPAPGHGRLDAGIANAGAPDAGVRCPRGSDVEGCPSRALEML